jgi:hypothetical protein
MIFNFKLFVFRIQIGAPRGNDTKLYPGVIEPGVVFRCPIAESCHAIKFDTAGKLTNELKILVALFNWLAHHYHPNCYRKYINLYERYFVYIYLFILCHLILIFNCLVGQSFPIY